MICIVEPTEVILARISFKLAIVYAAYFLDKSAHTVRRVPSKNPSYFLVMVPTNAKLTHMLMHNQHNHGIRISKIKNLEDDIALVVEGINFVMP
ncbi:hypothetical protein N9Y26_00840 [bacterium]|nr:hypothetical protein [bacterium]